MVSIPYTSFTLFIITALIVGWSIGYIVGRKSMAPKVCPYCKRVTMICPDCTQRARIKHLLRP